MKLMHCICIALHRHKCYTSFEVILGDIGKVLENPQNGEAAFLIFGREPVCLSGQEYDR